MTIMVFLRLHKSFYLRYNRCTVLVTLDCGSWFSLRRKHRSSGAPDFQYRRM